MTNYHIVRYDGFQTIAGRAVDHGSILDADSRTDVNVVDVTSDHSAVPNRTVITDLHVTNDRRRLSNKRTLPDLRSHPFEFYYHRAKYFITNVTLLLNMLALFKEFFRNFIKEYVIDDVRPAKQIEK